RATRHQLIADLDADVKQLTATLEESGGLKRFVAAADTDRMKVGTRVVGETLVTLYLPASTKVLAASERHFQTGENVQVAFALALYHREHGKYPNELTAL